MVRRETPLSFTHVVKEASHTKPVAPVQPQPAARSITITSRHVKPAVAKSTVSRSQGKQRAKSASRASASVSGTPRLGAVTASTQLPTVSGTSRSNFVPNRPRTGSAIMATTTSVTISHAVPHTTVEEFTPAPIALHTPLPSSPPFTAVPACATTTHSTPGEDALFGLAVAFRRDQQPVLRSFADAMARILCVATEAVNVELYSNVSLPTFLLAILPGSGYNAHERLYTLGVVLNSSAVLRRTWNIVRVWYLSSQDGGRAVSPEVPPSRGESQFSGLVLWLCVAAGVIVLSTAAIVLVRMQWRKRRAAAFRRSHQVFYPEVGEFNGVVVGDANGSVFESNVANSESNVANSEMQDIDRKYAVADGVDPEDDATEIEIVEKEPVDELSSLSDHDEDQGADQRKQEVQ